MLTKMVSSFYAWVYNVLKVMIYLGGQLSQFAFYIQFIPALPTNLFIRSWEYYLSSSKVEHTLISESLTIQDTVPI